MSVFRRTNFDISTLKQKDEMEKMIRAINEAEKSRIAKLVLEVLEEKDKENSKQAEKIMNDKKSVKEVEYVNCDSLDRKSRILFTDPAVETGSYMSKLTDEERDALAKRDVPSRNLSQIRKKNSPKVTDFLKEDADNSEGFSFTSEEREKLTVINDFEDMARLMNEIRESRMKSRNLSDVAFNQKSSPEVEKELVETEKQETANWLNQQMQEFSSEKLSDKDRDGVLQDFDQILTKNMFDKNSLDAILTHGAVENLEKLYGNAQSELLKAKRKATMLKLIVEKAHLLLEQQAASLLE